MTHSSGVIGHYNSDRHQHIEFKAWTANSSKKFSTALGYLLLVNSVLAVLLIVIDIVTLSRVQQEYDR